MSRDPQDFYDRFLAPWERWLSALALVLCVATLALVAFR